MNLCTDCLRREDGFACANACTTIKEASARHPHVGNHLLYTLARKDTRHNPLGGDNDIPVNVLRRVEEYPVQEQPFALLACVAGALSVKP